MSDMTKKQKTNKSQNNGRKMLLNNNMFSAKTMQYKSNCANQNSFETFEHKLMEINKQANIFIKLNKRFLKDCSQAFKTYDNIICEYNAIKKHMLKERQRYIKLSTLAKTAIKQCKNDKQKLKQAVAIINRKNQEIQKLYKKH